MQLHGTPRNGQTFEAANMCEKISIRLVLGIPRWLSGKIYLTFLKRRRLKSRTFRKGKPAPSFVGAWKLDFLKQTMSQNSFSSYVLIGILMRSSPCTCSSLC